MTVAVDTSSERQSPSSEEDIHEASTTEPSLNLNTLPPSAFRPSIHRLDPRDRDAPRKALKRKKNCWSICCCVSGFTEMLRGNLICVSCVVGKTTKVKPDCCEERDKFMRKKWGVRGPWYFGVVRELSARQHFCSFERSNDELLQLLVFCKVGSGSYLSSMPRLLFTNVTWSYYIPDNRRSAEQVFTTSIRSCCY